MSQIRKDSVWKNKTNKKTISFEYEKNLGCLFQLCILGFIFALLPSLGDGPQSLYGPLFNSKVLGPIPRLAHTPSGEKWVSELRNLCSNPSFAVY